MKLRAAAFCQYCPFITARAEVWSGDYEESREQRIVLRLQKDLHKFYPPPLFPTTFTSRSASTLLKLCICPFPASKTSPLVLPTSTNVHRNICGTAISSVRSPHNLKP